MIVLDSISGIAFKIQVEYTGHVANLSKPLDYYYTSDKYARLWGCDLEPDTQSRPPRVSTQGRLTLTSADILAPLADDV